MALVVRITDRSGWWRRERHGEPVMSLRQSVDCQKMNTMGSQYTIARENRGIAYSSDRDGFTSTQGAKLKQKCPVLDILRRRHE